MSLSIHDELYQVLAASLEEVVAGLVFAIEVHLLLPRLFQVLPIRKIKRGKFASARLVNRWEYHIKDLLHDLVLLLQGLLL